ncbi:hypothetical protein DFH29DRAFT_205732 [Suillus ampliporus]|nr:hypothetical protein DFH29DRAFT_205732 [Suillus ampliporus]
MQNDIIEPSDSDSDTNNMSARPVKQESTEKSHLNSDSELAALRSGLTAKSKLVAEQSKELIKLRKENENIKNERDLQNAEIAGLQDELKNILRQLDEQTVKSLNFNLIKLKKPDGRNGATVDATWHQDNDEDMSDSFASYPANGEDVPPDAAPSQPQNSGTSLPVIKPEPEDTKEKIAVVIKSEEGPDVNLHVTFVKSEDGKFDIWNLEHLRLGPPVIVEDRFNFGFTRVVISDALGGGHQTTFNNWQGPSQSTKSPYMALKRSWNPHLPLIPGDHGVVFCRTKRFKDGTLITRSVDLFVSGKVNEWIYFGSYETSRWGEITPHQLHLLPPLVIQSWVEGIISTLWGKSWVEETNSELVDGVETMGGEVRLVEYTKNGLREALEDGRLVIGFTVMKCVGFRTEWFDQFMHYQAHPKAKSQKRKKVNSGGKKPSAKGAKGIARRKEASSESDGEYGSSDTEDGMKACLGSAEPGARKSARISGRSVGASTSSSSHRTASLT